MIYFSLSATFGSFLAWTGWWTTIEHWKNPNVADREKCKELFASFSSFEFGEQEWEKGRWEESDGDGITAIPIEGRECRMNAFHSHLSR
jgi:hypothetical protein